MKLTMGTTNARGFAANFFAADQRLQRAVRRTVDRYGHEQFALTAALCPRRSGRMLRLLRLQFAPSGLAYEVGWDEADFAAEGQAPYFLYTEFGTRFMAPRPCLFPARDVVLPRYQRDLRAEIRGALRRRGRSG